MLHEIGSVRQDDPRGTRRWFQDDYFDLYLWFDPQHSLLAFQLCYARNRAEGAISWNRDAGFAHDKVDSGESATRYSMAPILRADGAPPYFRIYSQFLSASASLPQELRDIVIDRLRAYRVLLYGAPRKPRRAIRQAAAREPRG